MSGSRLSLVVGFGDWAIRRPGTGSSPEFGAFRSGAGGDKRSQQRDIDTAIALARVAIEDGSDEEA